MHEEDTDTSLAILSKPGLPKSLNNIPYSQKKTYILILDLLRDRKDEENEEKERKSTRFQRQNGRTQFVRPSTQGIGINLRV